VFSDEFKLTPEHRVLGVRDVDSHIGARGNILAGPLWKENFLNVSFSKWQILEYFILLSDDGAPDVAGPRVTYSISPSLFAYLFRYLNPGFNNTRRLRLLGHCGGNHGAPMPQQWSSSVIWVTVQPFRWPSQREAKFILERISVTIERFNSVLLQDSLCIDCLDQQPFQLCFNINFNRIRILTTKSIKIIRRKEELE